MWANLNIEFLFQAETNTKAMSKMKRKFYDKCSAVVGIMFQRFNPNILINQ